MTSHRLLGRDLGTLMGVPSVSAMGAEIFSSKRGIVDALKMFLQDTLGLNSFLKDTSGPDGGLREVQISETDQGGRDLSPDRLMAVLLEGSLNDLPAAQLELLTRILEAGLKVSMSRVQWLSGSSGENLIEIVNNAIGHRSVGTVPLLAFGGSWSSNGQDPVDFGRVFDLEGVQVLVTHGLREISESEAVKREAWSQLQKFRGLIRIES